MSANQFNTDVNNVKKVSMRIRRARELLKEIDNDPSWDRNFYSLLSKVNQRLEREGLLTLSEDTLINVIESIGWAV